MAGLTDVIANIIRYTEGADTMSADALAEVIASYLRPIGHAHFTVRDEFIGILERPLNGCNPREAYVVRQALEV